MTTAEAEDIFGFVVKRDGSELNVSLGCRKVTNNNTPPPKH
jgi:hypothetical protein